MLFNTEYWRMISGYENYEISSVGRVRNTKTVRVLKPSDNGDGYYQVSLYKHGKPKKFFKLHRLVAEAFLENPHDLECVDHRDGDKLNNNYENLRWCSYQQNNMNKSKRNNCSSGYKGVSFHKPSQKWRAYIMIDRTQKQLGLFENEKEAARKYNEKAIELFGDFAKLNDISDSDDENTEDDNTEDDNTEELET